MKRGSLGICIVNNYYDSMLIPATKLFLFLGIKNLLANLSHYHRLSNKVIKQTQIVVGLLSIRLFENFSVSYHVCKVKIV